MRHAGEEETNDARRRRAMSSLFVVALFLILYALYWSLCGGVLYRIAAGILCLMSVTPGVRRLVAANVSLGIRERASVHAGRAAALITCATGAADALRGVSSQPRNEAPLPSL